MRMWGVDPKLMCRQHLLGEHVEMHMIVGSLRRLIKLRGYTSTGLIDLRLVEKRHAQLVREMTRRGFNHRSPIDPSDADLIYFYPGPMGSIDSRANLKELARRCQHCRKQISGRRT